MIILQVRQVLRESLNIASAADSTGTKSSSVSDTDSSTSEQSLASAGQASAAEFDFDGFESDVDSSIEFSDGINGYYHVDKMQGLGIRVSPLHYFLLYDVRVKSR